MVNQIKGIIFDWRGTLSDNNKQLFSFVPKLLNELKKKYKLGLITNPSESFEERIAELKATGIFHVFNSVITTKEKSAADFKECMKQMGTDISTTAILDDRTVRGIKIGNQLGCTTIWIKHGNFPDQLPNQETGQPTYTINTAEELLTIL